VRTNGGGPLLGVISAARDLVSLRRAGSVVTARYPRLILEANSTPSTRAAEYQLHPRCHGVGDRMRRFADEGFGREAERAGVVGVRDFGWVGGAAVERVAEVEECRLEGGRWQARSRSRQVSYFCITI
jgi:hypothetical protein